MLMLLCYMRRPLLNVYFFPNSLKLKYVFNYLQRRLACCSLLAAFWATMYRQAPCHIPRVCHIRFMSTHAIEQAMHMAFPFQNVGCVTWLETASNKRLGQCAPTAADFIWNECFTFQVRKASISILLRFIFRIE